MQIQWPGIGACSFAAPSAAPGLADEPEVFLRGSAMSFLKHLKRHPFPVVAWFERVVAVSFAFPDAVLRPLVPSTLEIDAYEGLGFVTVALVWTNRETGAETCVQTSLGDRTPMLELTFDSREESAALPLGSPFPKWHAARLFAGPMPLTFSPEYSSRPWRLEFRVRKKPVRPYLSSFCPYLYTTSRLLRIYRDAGLRHIRDHVLMPAEAGVVNLESRPRRVSTEE